MHVVVIIVGRTGHPCWVDAIFSMSYFFLVFLLWLLGSISLQQVNSMIFTLSFWLGVRGGWVMGVVPIMHTTSMLSPGEAFAPQEARGCKGVAMSGEFFPVLYC